MALRIGHLASATGTRVETIRYYERIGLLPKPGRSASNYRAYSSRDARRLGFIRHARGLGFDIAEVRSLLALADEPDRDCAEVDAIATDHLAGVERRLTQLTALREELVRIVGACRAGRVAECRVLEVLGDHGHCAGEHGDTAVVMSPRRRQL